MKLINQMIRQGHFFFRSRSYLPLLLVALFIPAMSEFHYLGGSHRLQEAWEIVCLGVSLLGLGIRVISVGHAPQGTSGRNTSGQRAEALNTTGMYSLCRHPLYLGNFFVWLGVSLFVGAWWMALIVATLFFVYYERIMLAEEEFLSAKFGTEFEEWAARTPVFVPKLRQWVHPALPFSLRSVLRREHSSFAAMVTVFAALSLSEQWFVEGKIRLDPLWQMLLPVTWMALVVFKLLKKFTRLLDVEGR